MLSMTSYNQGNVILIPFPFTDLTTFKQRPAVIISSNVYNERHNDVIIICAITSNIKIIDKKYDVFLNESSIKSSGLLKSSIVKCDKIVTLDKRLVRKFLGYLSEKITRMVTDKVKGIF